MSPEEKLVRNNEITKPQWHQEEAEIGELPEVDRGVVNSSHDFFVGCGPF